MRIVRGVRARSFWAAGVPSEERVISLLIDSRFVLMRSLVLLRSMFRAVIGGHGKGGLQQPCMEGS